MARNIYKSAMTSGLASGKMRASMYDLASFESQKKMEDIEFQLESKRLDENIGNISDVLSLASTVAGRYGDISEDISTIEAKYGEMEQPEGMFKKLLQSTKIGFGVGEYQFGDKTIAAKDFSTTAAKLTQQNMFEEVMSNINKVDAPDKKEPLSLIGAKGVSKTIEDIQSDSLDIDPTKMTDDEFINYLNLQLANEK